MPEDEEILNDNFLKSREVLFIGNTKELEELSKASVLNVNKNLFNPLIIEFMNVSEEVAIKRIKNHLSNNRFKHSLRVAGTIKQIHEIAEINDAELCYDSYLAALYHDICKEMNINEQIKISKEKLGLESYESSKILHGPVGAWYIKEKYLLNKEDILEAISQHTVPSENPKMITMLLFLADHLEIEKKRRYPENLYQEVWNLISQKEIYAAFTKVKNYCDEKIKLKQLEKQPEFKDIK